MSSATSLHPANIAIYFASPNKGVKRKRNTIVVDKCTRSNLQSSLAAPVQRQRSKQRVDELDIHLVDPNGVVSPAVIAAMKQRIIEVRRSFYEDPG